MDSSAEKPTTSSPVLSSFSKEVSTTGNCPPADMVLWLAVFVLLLCFVYLFVEVWFPIKQGSAIIAIITAIVSFYFGAAYGKNAAGG